MAGSQSLNLVVLVGRVGNKGELKKAKKNDREMTRFSLGVDEVFRGSQTKYTTWVNVTCWGSTARFVDEYVPKGTLIIVQGRIHVFKPEKGDKIYYSVQANEITLLSRPKNADADEADEADQIARQPGQDDEEVPF